MFGYEFKKFGRNWLIVLIVALIGVSFGLGYNSITGASNLFAGFGALISLFGDAVWMLILAAVAVCVAFLLRYMTTIDYEDERGKQVFHIALVFAAIAAAFVCGSMVRIDEDFPTALGVFAVAVVIVTAATALVTHRTPTSNSRRSTTTP